MKKLQFISLFLLCLMLFSSCDGIGDGALFDNITTGEPKEITLEGEDEIVCKLVAYYAEGKEIMDEAAVEGVAAESIYAYLNDSSNYTATVDEVAMSHPYIHVTFEGVETPKIDLDSNNAVGGIEEFYVYSSDNVDITNVNLGSGRMGHLEGSYKKLFKYIEKYGAAMGHFCNISTSDAPHALIRASGEDVYTMFTTLMEDNYRDYTTWNYPLDYATSTYQALGDYINLAFFGSENMTYVIFSNDMVYKFDSSSDDGELYAPVGVLGGIYDKAKALLESSLDKVTDAEKEAHMKLNCLEVHMSPGISRTFYLSDFADIGGIYIKHMIDDNGYFALVYFEECTPGELEEKLKAVRKLSIVSYADKIPVAEEYYGTAFAE